ncbi:alpha/beta fold hydrolase [Massilia sp. PAMC28688]|uniref:alpha/beta hydrolase family protein n=1 Tax=Massilia sp. PAMC28688 TaxID=2861283 RepID=UPI001C62E965|nr:alpha/beta hydrolase [Massilia sp. PAMC28688]QYF92108.1 alpha/beta fold hydrolase [Massilia sp. PAMC28688]
MPSQRHDFPAADGQLLAASLDLPEGEVKAYALFAHCFTCTKDVFAAARIAHGLAARGIAVLRFDFTGLGSSEGEFANTNFSSNVQDLVAAANFMRAELTAPRLLIGHSLGGAAVLSAAGAIPEVKAVVTLCAPSDPSHVTRLFDEHLDTIEASGQAQVQLAGRAFTIKRQFLLDASEHRLDEKIAHLKRALLVMHSPQDSTVGIDNALHIFKAAMHPKSFVSLDDADHMLTGREDAQWAAAIIAAWCSRYVA